MHSHSLSHAHSHVTLVLLFILATASFLGAHAAAYHFLDRIPVMVNTIGPIHNPAEVYPFYSLPFCAPKTDFQTSSSSSSSSSKTSTTLGEAFAGHNKQYSLYDIRFKVDIQWQSLCAIRFTAQDVNTFIDGIQREYVFDMFVDGLPVQGALGEIVTEEYTPAKHQHIQNNDQHSQPEIKHTIVTEHPTTITKYYLFTHLDFSFAFNGDHVIALNLTADTNQKVELTKDHPISVEFSYSVRWWETQHHYSNRLELHNLGRLALESSLDIHWLSIINSFILVLLLIAFLAYILMRVLRNDVARYLDMEDSELGSEKEESGWKMINGDVFRTPTPLMVLTSSLGTGVQLLLCTFFILIFAMLGNVESGNRGAVYSWSIGFYAVTAGIAGFVSSYAYAYFGGEKWATNACVTAVLFAGPFFFVLSFVNSVALAYKSSTALPILSLLMVIGLWALVTFPLTIAGAIQGKRLAPKFEAPCKPKRVPREIPTLPWYRRLPVQIFVAGFLPFSAIYIELHYIFAAVWGFHIYNVFGILFLAFILLLLVTSFVTIALTYFQLASEDHRWWFRSFCAGGAIGFFIFAYGCFFYYFRSSMNGFLQYSFFFGYMFVISWAFFLALGTVGFLSSFKFIQHIYTRVHLS